MTYFWSLIDGEQKNVVCLNTDGLWSFACTG